MAPRITRFKKREDSFSYRVAQGVLPFDALEEVLHLMAPLVVTFVIGRWVGAVGGGWNACFEIKAFQQPSNRSLS